MPDQQRDVTLGEVDRQLKAIWSLMDAQGQADTMHGKELAELKGEVRNLGKIIEQYMTQGTPRCAERGQRISSMETALAKIAEKTNGGVGSSRACIEHKDLLVQHEKTLTVIGKDIADIKKTLTKDLPENLKKEFEERDKHIQYVRRWIYGVTLVLVVLGGIVRTFGPGYIERKNKQFRDEIVHIVREELQQAQQQCLKDYLEKQGSNIIPNLDPSGRYPVGGARNENQ